MSAHCPEVGWKERGTSAEVRVTHKKIHSIRALIWCLAQFRSRIHFQTRQSLPSSGETRRREEGKIRGLRWWRIPVGRNHMTKNGEKRNKKVFIVKTPTATALGLRQDRYGIFSVIKEQLFSTKLFRPPTVVFYGHGSKETFLKTNQCNLQYSH